MTQLMERAIERLKCLPEHIQELARRNYRLWRENPLHRSLQFKQVHVRGEIYSIRVGIGWRALG